MKSRSVIIAIAVIAVAAAAIAVYMNAKTKSTSESDDPAVPMQHKTASAGDFDMPEIPPAKLFQHAQPEMFKLDNGMDVWYIHNPLIPLMSMNLVFEGGAAADEADKAGRTSFMASMLKEGAAGRSAQEISDDIEFIGAALVPAVNQDTVSITMQCMTQFFDRGVSILSDIWLKPDFTPEAFERTKKIILNNLKQREDSPNTLSKLAANREFYGESHPYGRSVDGYASTIEAMTLDDLKASYQAIMGAGNAAIMAVGSMDIDAFKSLLNEKFGKLERKSSTSSASSPAELPTAVKRLTIVDKPHAPQTVIRIYQPGVAASSMKTFPMNFVNIPFGASFTSRLMQNIREDKGYSYGANSALVPMKQAGVFLSVSSVDTKVTGAALKEFIYELGRLPKGDFTQEEFERARETWKSELVQSFETQSGALSVITGLYLNKKPIDAINTFAEELQNMSLDAFNDYAREFPTLEQAAITLVGDKDEILSQIKELDLPEPTFRDAEGKIIP